MRIHVTVESVACPVCGGHEFDKNGIEQGMYLCCNIPGPPPNKAYCPGTQYYCKKCEKLYPDTMFGKHGDVYECKECGSIHWGYTERVRYAEKMIARMRGMSDSLNSIQRSIENDTSGYRR